MFFLLIPFHCTSAMLLCNGYHVNISCHAGMLHFHIVDIKQGSTHSRLILPSLQTQYFSKITCFTCKLTPPFTELAFFFHMWTLKFTWESRGMCEIKTSWEQTWSYTVSNCTLLEYKAILLLLVVVRSCTQKSHWQQWTWHFSTNSVYHPGCQIASPTHEQPLLLETVP